MTSFDGNAGQGLALAEGYGSVSGRSESAGASTPGAETRFVGKLVALATPGLLQVQALSCVSRDCLETGWLAGWVAGWVAGWLAWREDDRDRCR